MCDPQTFDSRDSRYKRPYGAVPSGTRVALTLRPPRAGGFSAATLIAYFEHRDEERRELPMPWRGLEGDRDVFDIALETGDYVGLVWYSFRLEGLDGRREELGPFQLTVYDGAEEVPAWFGEGVTYQIFPDRFRRTRVPDPTGMVGGRSVHTGWEEEPVYRPDSNGEVRNRDFFGGDLAGVREKLGYLRGLGVDTLYFCPIFEAPENHRYGTGDYEKIDPMLGTEADFRALCAEAHALGMRVVLDGVFNHQGFVSRYFNGDGSYESVGAVQSQDSPYYPWYHFSHWPDKYDSWWGIYSLPAVNEADPSYRRYIFGGADSIIRRWLAAGADGWRLDVADELPDDFIHGIHAAARQAKPEAVIIGEVWEDDRLRRAPPAHPGGTLRRADELPLPKRPALLPAGRGRLPLPAGHGDPAGELPALRLALGHELPGHPRHPPHPHPAGHGGRRAGARQGLAGGLPHVPRPVRPGKGPAEAGGPGALCLPRLPHGLLRG